MTLGRAGGDGLAGGDGQHQRQPAPDDHAIGRVRGITAVIPEPSDQVAHRKNRGSRGRRPPSFDAEDYKQRNVVERSFCSAKQWRGLASHYDKLALVYRGGMVLRAITLWLS